MFKNEIFIVRFGYSILYTVVTAYVMQWNISILFALLVFVSIFIGSLALQYGVWNTLLKIIAQKWRKWIFAVVELVSMLWFIMEILSFKEYISPSIPHTTPQDIAPNVAWIALTAAILISILCSEKEFRKRGAL